MQGHEDNSLIAFENRQKKTGRNNGKQLYISKTYNLESGHVLEQMTVREMKAVEKLRQAIKQRILDNFFATHSYPRKNVIDDLITENPFDFSKAWKDRFLEAMKHNFQHQLNNCDFYRKLCSHRKFHKNQLKSFDDIWNIPFILSDVFKFHEIETKTESNLRVKLSSSGTSGKKSSVALDVTSGQRLLASSYHTYKALGLVAPNTITNYIMMSYSLKTKGGLGTSNTDYFVSRLAPKKSIFYALDKNNKGEIEFLRDETVEKLHSFVKEGQPIRILGFLHHTCEVIKAYKKKYGKVRFPKHSYILSGGGWKNFAHLYDPGFEPLKFFKKNTTIDPRNARDSYALIEQEILFLECEKHRMHIPNIALACARNPATLEKLPYGKTGLLHLYTPLFESWPDLSILTTDYGYVGKSCSCSIGGPYLKVIGRAGLAKKQTCALKADQYIKELESEAER